MFEGVFILAAFFAFFAICLAVFIPLQGIFLFVVYKLDGGKMKFIPYMIDYFKHF